METQDFNYDAWDDPDWDEYESSHWDEEDDPHDDDYCCYDPRYTGPVGYCHCKEYAEQYHRDNLWYNRLRLWFYVQTNNLADWLRKKKIIPAPKHIIKCDQCEQGFDVNKYGLDCPHCGEENLPF